MSEEGHLNPERCLSIRELYICQWVDQWVAEADDEIVDWERRGGGILLEMKSGFNLFLQNSRGGKVILGHDEETDKKIKEEARKESRAPKILVPDAAHPYKIVVDWSEPDDSSFKIDGQFDLRTRIIAEGDDIDWDYERDEVIIPAWKVLSQGWYQRAILSGSHTHLKEKVIP